MKTRLNKLRLAATAAGLALALATNAWAQPRTFDLPAQDATQAIPEFAKQGGLQIIASGAQLRGVRTAPVKGELEPRVALAMLLKGTGLVVTSDDGSTITIGAATTDSSSDPTGPSTSLDGLLVTGYRTEASAGGTRIVTPIRELPMSLQVVSRDLIDDLGARRIEDAVRFVSGINKVNRNDSFGRGERFAIRGFNSGLILRNGVPYNVLSDTANIEQIDIIKGANSILYGFNDPGGLINFTTRTPRDQAAYSVKQFVGSFDYYRTELDLTGPLVSSGPITINYRLIGAYTDAGSWLENGFEKTTFFNPVVDFHFGSSTLLRIDYEKRRTRSRFQRDSYPFLFNGLTNAAGLRDDSLGYAHVGARYSNIFPSDYNLDTSSNLEVRLTHKFTDNLSVRLSAAHTEISVDRYNLIGFLLEPGSDRLLRRRNLLELGEQETDFLFGDVSWRFRTPYMTHTIVAGGQSLKQSQKDLGVVGQFGPIVDVINPSPDPRVRYFRSETRAELLSQGSYVAAPGTETYGFFATDQVKLADDRTNILVGVRYDQIKATASGAKDVDNVTPQIGINYEVTPNFSLYALYSESFRLNPFVTRVGLPPLTFPPEKGANREVGFKFDILDKRLSGTVAVFQLDRENVLQVNAGGDPRNPVVSLSGQERSEGVEVDFAGRVTDRLKVFGSYAHTKASILKSGTPGLNGAPLEGVSPNAFSLFGEYDLGKVGPGALSANAGVVWRDGPIYTLNNSLASSQLLEDGYTAIDVGADYKFSVHAKDISVGIKVTNLTDEEYIDRRSAYAAPRRINMVLRGQF